MQQVQLEMCRHRRSALVPHPTARLTSQIAVASNSSNLVPNTRLLASLQQSTIKPFIGSWLEFPGYTLASTLASLCFYDCEHGNISDTEMYHSVAAIASQGISSIIRSPRQ
ncbi:hypothetical protein AC578_729 [Pseudocercospora eumusae]|uniref:Uncharacterized protein n=1 Tax=Pseudocercospora eumusae TaxID=321146 RepID=A0A139HMZ5_9PEZI|nr:hypothetical protein AC578_729 [Pseudocercospora eumusae]